MNYADTVRFLFSLGPELKTVKWDLERVRVLLHEIGDPHIDGRFVHVAGTNGKGSTCALIESALRVSGFRTGLYTSPHLHSPLERIRIAGEPISEELWTEVFREVHGASERLLATETLDTHPSFFETVTAMALLVFRRAKVDIAVIEVGLGGRLDATNVIEPEVAVITPIDFDHEAFLGSAIESIAAEKVGILKPGRPAVFSRQRSDALRILEHKALELNIHVTHSAALRVENIALHPGGSRFTVEGIQIECALAGEHQIENARTAIAALRVLNIEWPAIQAGIADAKWPGRLERISDTVILDGAHNPAGAKALAAYITQFFPDEPIRIIYGAMRDKAIEEVTSTLFPLAAEVIVTAPGQPRALNPHALAESIEHPKLRVAATLSEALDIAAKNPMTTFITGSLFLIAEARR